MTLAIIELILCVVTFVFLACYYEAKNKQHHKILMGCFALLFVPYILAFLLDRQEQGNLDGLLESTEKKQRATVTYRSNDDVLTVQGFLGKANCKIAEDCLIKFFGDDGAEYIFNMKNVTSISYTLDVKK